MWRRCTRIGRASLGNRRFAGLAGVLGSAEQVVHETLKRRLFSAAPRPPILTAKQFVTGAPAASEQPCATGRRLRICSGKT